MAASTESARKGRGGSGYAEALVRLGAITSLDVTSLAPTTLSSIISHVRTLQRNGVTISRETLGENPLKVLNSLRDTKGNKLSSDYKRQIGMTIKRMYPDLHFSLKSYKVESYIAETRRASPQYLAVARNLLLQAARSLALIDADSDPIGETLALYDTCLAILITSSTSLRIHEIYDMQMSHIKMIRRNEPISLRSKGNKTLRSVVLNDLLLRVFGIIERNRSRCVAGIREIRSARMVVRAHYASRLRDDYILLSSVDFMRKRLRELAASTGADITSIKSRSLGFNMFRSFVVSVLSDGGGHEIARALNNHSSVNTTLDHYTVVGPKASEATYDQLDKLIDTVTPVRSLSDNDDDETGDAKTPSGESLRASSKPSRQAKRATNHPFETPMSQPGDRYYDYQDESTIQ